MGADQKPKVRFLLTDTGIEYSAILPAQHTEIEISLEEFKVISHWEGLKVIASAIDDLQVSVSRLAEIIEKRGGSDEP